MRKALFNWSGGKDSAMAYYLILQEKKYEIASLLTSVNEQTGRISMHGVRKDLLIKQVYELGQDLKLLELPEKASMSIYEERLGEIMHSFENEGVRYSIFGDIFLEDLRNYRDKQLQKVNMKGVYPLWKRNTSELAHEFIKLGFKAIVTAVDAQKLDKSFCGRIIDEAFLNDLPEDVDPCGENGEFHSFVFDGPVFNNPVKFTKGDIIYKEYTVNCQDFEDKKETPGKKTYVFWFCDLLSTN